MPSMFDAVLRDPVSANTSTRTGDGVREATTETATRSFGALLKHYRIQVGISQETLAEDARLSAETISALERGSRRNPYRETVALLAKALRLSPAERTSFELAARRPTVTRALTLTRTSYRMPGGPPANLTAQLTSSINCERVVGAVAAVIRASRLVTLTGSGGVAKTQFALRIAAGLSATLADGAYFVDLAPLADSRLIASTIADTLGSRVSASAHPNAALRDLLVGKQMLLVFDNCEHVIAAVGALAKVLLRECPQLMLLVASRQALEIAGEATFRIASLLPECELRPDLASFACASAMQE